MRKVLSTVSVLGICATLSAFPVMAADKLPQVTSQTIVMSSEVADSKYEVKWNEKHNRVLVASNFVEDYFDAKVSVNGNNIDITKGNHKLHFEIGNEFYVMDDLGGRKVDCQAEITDGKVYLPLRFICEAFGASVKYDYEKQAFTVKTNDIVMKDEVKKYFENVQVFDNSTVRITGDKTVYVDPRRVLGEPHDADIIFITHTHNDHYEIDTIKRVMNENTKIYITKDGVEKAKADGLTNVFAVDPNMSFDVDGLKVSTVASYNDGVVRKNHKQEFNWVGYIVTINGYTYYFAGDTDFIEEMKSITTPIDVAFLPIDGKYNMPADEAAKAANAIKPKVAVPYHYNNFVAEDKAQEFTGLLDEGIDSAIVTFKMQ